VDETSTIILKGGSNGRLMVALPYSVERVARVKSTPGRRWHPKEKCWSVPNTEGMVEGLLTLFAGEQVEVDPARRPVRVPDNREPPLASGSTPVVRVEPSLFDRVRQALQPRHYSHRTEQAYVAWIERKRHPGEMGEREINQFLTDLAVKQKVSASTQSQALSALLFLYRHVLNREIGDLGDVIRIRKPQRLPVVMTRDEVKAVLGQLTSHKWLMASLMYGVGLRLMECLRLRVKDIDFERSEITVRNGKGEKNRRTILPESLKQPLQDHL